MPGPTLLIAGGYDKEAQYDEWVEEFDGKVKYLVLIGQTRDKIAECAKEHGFTDIMYAEDMSEAVRVCASYANMGDNVLLSPAGGCSGIMRSGAGYSRNVSEICKGGPADLQTCPKGRRPRRESPAIGMNPEGGGCFAEKEEKESKAVL